VHSAAAAAAAAGDTPAIRELFLASEGVNVHVSSITLNGLTSENLKFKVILASWLTFDMNVKKSDHQLVPV
jgi:hypothetical protein